MRRLINEFAVRKTDIQMILMPLLKVCSDVHERMEQTPNIQLQKA